MKVLEERPRPVRALESLDVHERSRVGDFHHCPGSTFFCGLLNWGHSRAQHRPICGHLLSCARSLAHHPLARGLRCSGSGGAWLPPQVLFLALADPVSLVSMSDLALPSPFSRQGASPRLSHREGLAWPKQKGRRQSPNARLPAFGTVRCSQVLRLPKSRPRSRSPPARPGCATSRVAFGLRLVGGQTVFAVFLDAGRMTQRRAALSVPKYMPVNGRLVGQPPANPQKQGLATVRAIRIILDRNEKAHQTEFAPSPGALRQSSKRRTFRGNVAAFMKKLAVRYTWLGKRRSGRDRAGMPVCRHEVRSSFCRGLRLASPGIFLAPSYLKEISFCSDPSVVSSLALLFGGDLLM